MIQKIRSWKNHTPRSSLYSRTIIILGLNQLIEHIAFGIPYSYFPKYAISLGAPVASIGLFTSSFMFMSAILSPYLGGYSDKFGRKKMVVLGLVGDVILGALTGLAPSWEWLLLIRGLNGAATAAAVIPAEALLIDSSPLDRVGEATGFAIACGTVGRNIGPMFGGGIQWLSVSYGLSELDSYRIPYFVDAAFAAVSAMLINFGLEDDKKVLREECMSRHSQGRIPKSFRILLLCAFITGIGEGFIRPIIALFFSDVFNAEPIEIGFLMSLSGFIALTASWLSGRASDRFGRKAVIAIGGIPARILGSLIPLGDLTLASIFYTARDFMWRVYNVGLRSLRADISPREVRGRLFGLYRTFFDIGDMIGPVAATYLYDVYRYREIKIGDLILPGYGVPFYLNSAIGLLIIAILLVFVKAPRLSHEEV